MTLTISERRAVMTAAARPDFRDLMRRDPHAGLALAAHRPAAEGLAITVIEERPSAWEFVIPATAIEADLPEAEDPRAVVENDVYAMLRDQPDVRSRILHDPKAFLAETFSIDTGETAVNVREEQQGELMIVLPLTDARDELDDSALDLVAGGGQTGCQMADPQTAKR